MARLNISDVLLLFVFVRATSLPTHILLSPDSLPPPERFHLKCSFEFYCRLLISTLTCTSGFTFKHSVLQLGRHDIFPQISSITVCKISNFQGHFLGGVELCTCTFSLHLHLHYNLQFTKSVISKEIFWEMKVCCCAHLHFQLPLLPRNSLLVGMKPLALQPFFFWIQIHFNNFHPISICTISTVSFTYYAISICLRDIAQWKMHHPNCIAALSVTRNECDTAKCWCPHLSQMSSLLLASFLTNMEKA